MCLFRINLFWKDFSLAKACRRMSHPNRNCVKYTVCEKSQNSIEKKKKMKMKRKLNRLLSSKPKIEKKRSKASKQDLTIFFFAFVWLVIRLFVIPAFMWTSTSMKPPIKYIIIGMQMVIIRTLAITYICRIWFTFRFRGIGKTALSRRILFSVIIICTMI